MQIALKEASGSSSKKAKSRSSTAGGASTSADTPKLGGTPSGTAASSRSSTPFESNKRRGTKEGSGVADSGGKLILKRFVSG